MRHKPQARAPLARVIQKLGFGKTRSAAPQEPPARSQEEIEWEMSAEDALRVLTTEHAPLPAASAPVSSRQNPTSECATFKPRRHVTESPADPLDPGTPIEPPASMRKPEPAPSAQGVVSAANRILIAESHHELRRTLVTLLTRLGLEVVQAETGKQALLALKTTPFAVAMIDVKLPDMPAEALVARLRKLPEGQNLPVILTAQDDCALDPDHGEWLNIHQYLLKPFSLAGLYQTLSEFCTLHKPKRANHHRGVLGLVIENDTTRWMLRRLLVRHGFHISISGRPQQLEKWLMVQAGAPIDGWLVDIEDSHLCTRVLDDLDRMSDAPVITGLPLERPTHDDTSPAQWERALVSRITRLVSPKATASGGQA